MKQVGGGHPRRAAEKAGTGRAAAFSATNTDSIEMVCPPALGAFSNTHSSFPHLEIALNAR